MLVRRDGARGLGGLDEGFFLYCEDIDLCRRPRDAGYDVRFEPAATAMHVGGSFGSSGVAAPDARREQDSLRAEAPQHVRGCARAARHRARSAHAHRRRPRRRRARAPAMRGRYERSCSETPSRRSCAPVLRLPVQVGRKRRAVGEDEHAAVCFVRRAEVAGVAAEDDFCAGGDDSVVRAVAVEGDRAGGGVVEEADVAGDGACAGAADDDVFVGEVGDGVVLDRDVGEGAAVLGSEAKKIPWPETPPRPSMRVSRMVMSWPSMTWMPSMWRQLAQPAP